MQSEAAAKASPARLRTEPLPPVRTDSAICFSFSMFTGEESVRHSCELRSARLQRQLREAATHSLRRLHQPPFNGLNAAARGVRLELKKKKL